MKVRDRPPRVVLHPGFIFSSHDGQRHYIGTGELARLYRLRASDDVVVSDPSHRRQPKGDDIHLYPSYDGSYRRPYELFTSHYAMCVKEETTMSCKCPCHAY